MADVLPLKLVDLGSGQGALSEFEDGDQIPMDLVTGLEDALADIGFTIIYPNGGTESSPASVSIDSRYVMSNPFSPSPVLCSAEIRLADGKWTPTGWVYSDVYGAAGVSAMQLNSGDIIVQTGKTRLINTSNTGGDPRGDNVNVITAPTPCRVKVWKIQGAAP